MPLNIKNTEVEKLLDDVVHITGETKTEAVRKALVERRQRLVLGGVIRDDESRLLNFLRDEVWPTIPEDVRGKRLTKGEEEAILGYGEAGV